MVIETAPESPPIGTRFSTGEDLYLLDQGPTEAPPGAQTVPAGDNSALTPNFNQNGFSQTNKVFWFAPGVHTLGNDQFAQIQPGSGSTYVGAPGAVIDGQMINEACFTQGASNVSIRYLEIVNFVSQINQFVVNHDAGVGWVMEYLNLHSNNGSAIGISSQGVLKYCWIHDNQQYAFSATGPVTNNALDPGVNDVLIDHCEIAGSGDQTDEILPNGTGTGHGRNGACKFWDTSGITLTHCWVHDNVTGIWADTNNIETLIQGNLIEDNWGIGVFYEISFNILIQHNTLRRNAQGWGIATNGDTFPRAAIYMSESGSEPRILGLYNTASEIRFNRFENNWDEVLLWENADRFCNSPVNTSGNIWKPLGGTASLAVCNNPVSKNLTVTLTSGSPLFTVTSGTFEYTDEGRAVTGTGIPGGTEIQQERTANGFTPGWISSTQGRLTQNATVNGSQVITLAAGSINTEPGYTDCRWRTQNVKVHDNLFFHNRSEVLGPNTLAGGMATGKHGVFSNSGSTPAWSPYTGDVIRNAITFNQGNSWYNNTYRGDYDRWLPHNVSNATSFVNWQAAPYNQDSGSTLNTSPLTGMGGGNFTVAAAPTSIVATAGNGQAKVTFLPPTDKGGDTVVGYQVTSSPGGIVANGFKSPIAVPGLTNGIAYTFTVKTRNTVGLSPASSASNSVTPDSGASFSMTAAPWYPTYPTARRRTSTTAEVSFMRPVVGAAVDPSITSYTATSSPGGLTGSGPRGPITVSGLTPGIPYTFTITATNATGTGPPSVPTFPITL